MAFNQFPSKGGIPSGNTAARPTNPVIGDTYYNGQLEILEIYNGTQWVAVSAPPSTPQIISVTDASTGDAYTSTAGKLAVVFTAGSGGGTPSQYNAFTVSGGHSASSSSTTVTLTGLTPATSYEVYGNGQNNFGTTVNTPNQAAVTPTTRPQAPTIGTATASTSVNQLTVTWTLNATGGKNLSAITITPYRNGTTAETSRTAATTSSTSYQFTEGQLVEGGSYTFKIKTTNANGDSPESSASNSANMPGFFTANYLIVAGGASGGGGRAEPSNRQAGGGGAGGLRSTISPTGGGGSPESALTLNSGVNYAVSIGAGGASTSSDVQGNQGVDTTFNSITAAGGGAGGKSVNFSGSSGGSGGGGGSQSGGGGSGTANQGYSGAAGGGSNTGGGGGGAGGSGSASSGGSGVSNNITGSSVYYAQGGTADQSNASGGANTGTGGSGSYEGSNPPAGAGGSGVVILRYPDTKTISIGAGLTGTESAASGGFKRATITAGSGNVSWS